MQKLREIKNNFASLEISKLVEIETSKTTQKTSKILSKKISYNIDFTLQNLHNS